MTLAPWYFLSYFLTPVQTEPVLVPLATLEACEEYADVRVDQWRGYAYRNRGTLGPDGNRLSVTAANGWAEPLRHWTYGQVFGSTFRIKIGSVVIVGGCAAGWDLTPDSLKALRTSP